MGSHSHRSQSSTQFCHSHILTTFYGWLKVHHQGFLQQDAADLITPISYFTPLSSSHSNSRLLCWFLFFAWCKSCLSLFQRDVQLIWSLSLLLLVSRAPVHFSSSPQAVSCRRQLSPLACAAAPSRRGISSSGWQDKQALASQLTPCCQYYVKYKKDWVKTTPVTAFQ